MKQNKEIPEGYKDSSLGIVPEEWEVMKLENVCSFYSGGTPSKDVATYWNGNIPWISAATMHEQNINSSNLFITKEGLINGSKLANNGDLLLLVRGSMLWNKIPICECLCDVAFNQDVKNIKANESVISKFLLYWFLSQENYLLHQVVGTGIGAGKLETQGLKDILFALPPLPEQQKIAEILTTWDSAIEKQTALIEKLELRKRGLMQQLLTGKKRLGNFSEEWKSVKLGDICKLSSGKAKPSEVASNIDNIYQYPIYGGNGILGYAKKYSDFDKKIIIGRVGEYCGITRLVDGYYWITDNALFSKFISANTDITYLTYKLQFMDLSKWRSKGGQPLISQQPIHSLLIDLPSQTEQMEIRNILIITDREIELVKLKQIVFCSQKQALIRQLLTGKTRIKT